MGGKPVTIPLPRNGKTCGKTDVVELSITVRSTIIQGRDKYVNALAWAAEFELDTDFFQTNAKTAFSNYDYAIDTAQLVETTVYFGKVQRIQRRKNWNSITWQGIMNIGTRKMSFLQNIILISPSTPPQTHRTLSRTCL